MARKNKNIKITELKNSKRLCYYKGFFGKIQKGTVKPSKLKDQSKTLEMMLQASLTSSKVIYR